MFDFIVDVISHGMIYGNAAFSDEKNDFRDNRSNKTQRKGKRVVSFCMIGVLCVSGLFGCSNETYTQNTNWQEDDTIIRLYQHETNDVVEITLGEYLCGVLAGEMENTWAEEALKAQAILARTFTLEKMEDHAMAERNVDASTDIHEFQAYNAAKINKAIRDAVKDTENKVVTYKGALIKAWFFSDGGGITAASAKEGLSYDKEETPYIKSVADPGAKHPENPNQSWMATFSMNEVADAIASVTGVTRERYQTVEIAERGESGRAMTYQFDNVVAGAAALRLALGGETMKSNLVDEIYIQNDTLYVKGRGYGHGVGMSQWGARTLAEEGKDAEEIIHYFFQNVTIAETGQS